jgi:hypothetical protein
MKQLHLPRPPLLRASSVLASVVFADAALQLAVLVALQLAHESGDAPHAHNVAAIAADRFPDDSAAHHLLRYWAPLLWVGQEARS